MTTNYNEFINDTNKFYQCYPNLKPSVKKLTKFLIKSTILNIIIEWFNKLLKRQNES